MKTTFWKDRNDYGTYMDGRVVETGLLFEGEPRFEERPNYYGGVCPTPIGRFIRATREIRGNTITITTHGEWRTRS